MAKLKPGNYPDGWTTKTNVLIVVRFGGVRGWKTSDRQGYRKLDGNSVTMQLFSCGYKTQVTPIIGTMGNLMFRKIQVIIALAPLFFASAEAVSQVHDPSLANPIDGVGEISLPESVAECLKKDLPIRSVRINSANYNPQLGGIVLNGCFGMNVSKRLTIRFKSTPHFLGRNDSYSGTQVDPRLVIFTGYHGRSSGAYVDPAYIGPSAGTTIIFLYRLGSINLLPTHEFIVTVAEFDRPSRDELKAVTGWVKVDGVTPRLPYVNEGHPDYDADGDGFYVADCNDFDPDINPDQVEIPDKYHTDEDCNPATYETSDQDGDGYFHASYCNRGGTQGNTLNALCGKDCNDLDNTIHPLQIDILNNRDDNCDGKIDEDQSPDQLRQLLGLD